ncbi:MAG: NUDIX domain-containing protein [Rickettsiales bacterium]|jgi:8-oxo-dGTP pyrophosphatase MutT (NUDIX family)|nr:NUDIX domain-containing protein [Rickettsiales bacterium]
MLTRKGFLVEKNRYTIDRYRITTAVYAVILKDGQLLMSLRQNTGFMDGSYGLVSGHVEAGETLAEALVRETREEANIHVKKAHLGTTLFRSASSPEFNDYIDFFFLVDDFDGEIKNNEPNKCGELKFFPLDELPGNTISYAKYCVENLLQGISYCEWPLRPGN